MLSSHVRSPLPPSVYGRKRFFFFLLMSHGRRRALVSDPTLDGALGPTAATFQPVPGRHPAPPEQLRPGAPGGRPDGAAPCPQTATGTNTRPSLSSPRLHVLVFLPSQLHMVSSWKGRGPQPAAGPCSLAVPSSHPAIQTDPGPGSQGGLLLQALLRREEKLSGHQVCLAWITRLTTNAGGAGVGSQSELSGPEPGSCDVFSGFLMLQHQTGL